MSVTNNIQITLTVLATNELGSNSMSVTFRRPIGFNYEAGDWVDLKNPGDELKGGKTYSLSSSPTEGELEIMFRKGLSPFKQYLQNLNADDELLMTQFGNDYNFHLRENRNSVLIAGGIGIAPFRSMLKEMKDLSNSNQVQLLYFNKGTEYLLSDDLNEWSKSIPLDLRYFNTDELMRKDRIKVFQNVMSKEAHHYFIAGPENMVENTEHLLIDFGIDPKDIRIDSFGGY